MPRPRARDARRPPCRDDSPSLTEASQLQRRRQRRHTAHRHTRARSYHPFIFYLARGLKPYQARHHMSALRAPSYESRPTPHSRPRSHPARTLTPHTPLQNKPHHQKSMISQNVTARCNWQWHTPPFETRKTILARLILRHGNC